MSHCGACWLDGLGVPPEVAMAIIAAAYAAGKRDRTGTTSVDCTAILEAAARLLAVPESGEVKAMRP